MIQPLDENANELRFDCPRCGHSNVDEYELLDPGLVHDWRCSSCQKSFALRLAECECCAAESVEIALTQSELGSLAAEFCLACGRPAASLGLVDDHEEEVASGLG